MEEFNKARSIALQIHNDKSFKDYPHLDLTYAMNYLMEIRRSGYADEIRM